MRLFYVGNKLDFWMDYLRLDNAAVKNSYKCFLSLYPEKH